MPDAGPRLPTGKGSSPAPAATASSATTATAAAPQTSSETSQVFSVSAYERNKKELREMLSQKRMLDKNLLALEEQIYKAEGQYLEDTALGGNLIRGFDGYIRGNASRRKPEIQGSDRLISLSSGTYLETIGALVEEDLAGSAKRRKKRDKDSAAAADNNSDSDEMVTNKRVKITFKTESS